MSRIRYAIAAAALVSALWAQTGAPPAANSGAAAPPASQSKPPDAGTPPATNPSPAPSAPAPATPPPDSKLLELVKKVKPEYPSAALPEKLQGQVIVRIVVNENGDVESAEVISGNPVLASAAVDAVKQWKFKPFIKNGQPVKAAIKLPFDFAPPAVAPPDSTPKPPDANSPPAKPDAPKGSEPTKNQAENANPGTAPPKRIRVASGVTQGMVLHRVEPSYPIQARLMRVQGTVVLQAIISKEGTLTDLHVVSGPPLLTQAAIDAVKQWRYRPYVLNGEPFEVETTVEVKFWMSN